MDQSLISKLGDGVKIEMVTEDQMNDADRNSVFNREQTVDAIPDLDELSRNVYEILKYLEDRKTRNYMETKANAAGVRMLLNNKYADKMPLGMIDMLMEEECREENVERILEIIDFLREAKREGNDKLKELDDVLHEKINKRYMYDKYGSKEAFEKALEEEIKNEQKKNGGKQGSQGNQGTQGTQGVQKGKINIGRMKMNN